MQVSSSIMLIITTQKYFYCTQFSMRFNISIKPRHISKKPCTVSYDSFFSHGRSSYVLYYFYYCSKLDLLGEIICICFSDLSYYSYAWSILVFSKFFLPQLFHFCDQFMIFCKSAFSILDRSAVSSRDKYMLVSSAKSFTVDSMFLTISLMYIMNRNYP